MDKKSNIENAQDFQPYSKWVYIVVGTIVATLIIGVLFYQTGYSAGVKSVEVPSQTQESGVISDQDGPKEELKPSEPILLTGVGQQASKQFELLAGLATVKLTHDGTSNFAVWVFDSMGERIELLVNETGIFDGSKAFSVPADGKYLLDVSADGAWQVTIQQ